MDIPRPRDTSRTLIGLEAPMTRKEETTPVVPQSVPADLRNMTTHQLAVHLYNDLRSRDEDFRKQAEEMKQRDDRRDGWVEGQLEDVRQLIIHAREKELEIDKLVTIRDGEILKLHAICHDHTTGLERVEKLIGAPPKDFDARVSQVGDYTAEQMAELDSGTGLYGLLGRLATRQQKQDEAVRKQGEAAKHQKSTNAISAASGAGGVAVVLELVKVLPPAWAPYGAGGVAGAGLLAVLGRVVQQRIKAWRKAKP